MGTSGYRNHMVAVHLIKSYCLPSMLYGCETWSINRSDMRTLDIAWNNAFRKIFNAFWRESVKPLLYYCACLPVSYVLPVPMRRKIFWRKMYYSSNTVLNALAKAGRESLFAVADVYNISVSELLHVDKCTIKSLVWEHFVHSVNW